MRGHFPYRKVLDGLVFFLNPLGQTGVTAVTFLWVEPFMQVIVVVLSFSTLVLRAVFSFCRITTSPSSLVLAVMSSPVTETNLLFSSARVRWSCSISVFDVTSWDHKVATLPSRSAFSVRSLLIVAVNSLLSKVLAVLSFSISPLATAI